MGLTFHYKGTIRSLHLIDEMTEEVKDICKSLNWDYRIWEKKETKRRYKSKSQAVISQPTPEDVKGISISPPECETLFLTFLPNGDLCSPIKLIYYDPATNDIMIEMIHTKTQFAGPDTHIALMELLRYLNEKYFAKLEVDDEGMYWGKWDKKILYSQFSKYNVLLDIVVGAL